MAHRKSYDQGSLMSGNSTPDAMFLPVQTFLAKDSSGVGEMHPLFAAGDSRSRTPALLCTTN